MGLFKKVSTACLSLLLLMGCASNASAKFKEAGCSELKDFRFDLAAQQFDLAAQNGDPEAVKAASNSRRMAFLLFYNSPSETREEMEERLKEISYFGEETWPFCGLDYGAPIN